MTFHPEKDMTLLDVTSDGILVVHGSLTESQSLRFGSLRGFDYTSPTTPRPRSVLLLLECLSEQDRLRLFRRRQFSQVLGNNRERRGSEKHRGSVRASHPADPGLNPSIPEVFPSMLLRLIDGTA